MIRVGDYLYKRVVAINLNSLDEFTLAYIDAAFGATNVVDDKHGEISLDEVYGVGDIDSNTLEEMVADCKRFQEENQEVLDEAEVSGRYVDEMAGYDFWMTRNGHGDGFWDGDWSEPHGDLLDKAAQAFGPYYIYVDDDDDMIYGSRG